MRKIQNASARILIVDSHKASATSLLEMLEALGYVVHHASDMASAQVLLKSTGPELVVLSLKTAFDLIKIIRSRNPEAGSSIPILGLLDQPKAELKRLAFEQGVSDFLPHPYDQVDVEARVKSLLAVRSLQQRTQYLATHDSLTRCYNRSSLVEFLNREVERYKRFQRPFTLLLLDLDGFSAVNKAMGQPMGDQALTHVGYRLQDFFRAVDCVARLDGDQFAAVLPDCGLSAAMKVGDRIMSDLLSAQAKPALPKSLKNKLRFSVGISVMPEHGEDLETIFQTAEKALAAVKKSGGSKFRVYSKKHTDN